MGERHTIDWNKLDYAEFARLAKDDRLSKYEKIGFPNPYRENHEVAIFADIQAKLPRLKERAMTVLDIGPGCSDLPAMLIELCRTRNHQLCLVDSPEMLSQLPNAPTIRKTPGPFPECRPALADLKNSVDVILCYSVLHYVFAANSTFAFLDAALELLAPGGEFLIGDIPNVSKRRRFFSSAAGIAFHKNFTGTDTMPEDVPIAGSIDDSVLIGLVLRARAAGADAYIVPQDPALPMANRREDLLIRRP